MIANLVSAKVASLSIGNFKLDYIENRKIVLALHSGNNLAQEIKAQNDIPFKIWNYYPRKSEFNFKPELVALAGEIFDAVSALHAKGEYCVAAMLASFLFEQLTLAYQAFQRSGMHILGIPYWRAVLDLVWDWERRHPSDAIHKGTPYYFLGESYILCGDWDAGFLYLFNAIEDDIRLGRVCSGFNYPNDAPAFKTACLIDEPHNRMYEFVVKPVREHLKAAIAQYQKDFGTNNYLPNGIDDLDIKFLRRRNTTKLKVESIKFLFTLEMLQLMKLKELAANKKLNSSFSQTLLLNRLFGLSLVVDKLLHLNYPSQTRRGEDPLMSVNVLNYARNHGITQATLESFYNKTNFRRRSLELLLPLLIGKMKQKRFRIFPKEMYPILITLKIRNTSAHKITSQNIILSQFDEILQYVLEAVFIIVGQMPKSRKPI